MTKKKSKKEDSKYFNKKFFTFFTIAAFFVFAIVLVVAPLGVDKASITGNAPGDTYINGDGNTVNIPSGDSFPVGDKDNGEVPRDGFFSNWFNGTLSVGFLKIFFFVLVTMLIFSILHMSGIPNNKVLQFLFAGVVGFVSTAYIVPAE